MNLLYIGAALVAMGLLIAILSMSFTSSAPTGVAKSLMLI